jgi:Leucine-rich repeat (LRR) protein
MNTDNIEIASFDNLLVYKKEYTPEIVSRIITERKLGGLRIFAVLKDDRLESLDFLRAFTFLERLDITSALDYDFNFLKDLARLKKLSISTEGSNEINLSSLHDLQYLSIKWRKKITGLENCKKLSSLTLVEFKEKDLQKVQGLKSLVELRIKTGTIENLSGADKLLNLRTLNIGNCKKLQSIKAINHLPNLKELYLDTCQNINNYEEVTDLPNLEALSLTDCGKVQSLKFIERYPALQKLSLLGNTVIVDGDLVPAKRIKSVEHKHYSHYNVKVENPSYNQNVKNNLEKIKNWFK